MKRVEKALKEVRGAKLRTQGNELTGAKFGRLTVLGEAIERNSIGNVRWICSCECGNYTVVDGHNLNSGATASCGCIHKETITKHGLSLDENGKPTRLFLIWNGMKNRCYNSNDKAYKWYGGKNIKVCDEWLNDYPAFYNWAYDNGYKEGLSIDRINPNGNYEPNNCQWLTRTDNTKKMHMDKKNNK